MEARRVLGLEVDREEARRCGEVMGASTGASEGGRQAAGLTAGVDMLYTAAMTVEDIEKAIAQHETTLALKGELEAHRARLSTLTPRQRQVFEIIVRGKTNEHAARELDSSERTRRIGK